MPLLNDGSQALTHRCTSEPARSLEKVNKLAFIHTKLVQLRRLTCVEEVLVGEPGMVDVMYRTGEDGCHDLQRCEHSL